MAVRGPQIAGDSDDDIRRHDVPMTAEPGQAGGGHRLPWWVAVITLVVGVAVGVIATGLLRSDSPVAPTAPGPTATPATPSSQPSVDTTAGSAGAQVNAACLRVIQDAQEVYEIIAGVGEATADVDLQRLDDMVRQLQPIEPRLQRDLQDCNVATSAAPNPGQATPTASPTG